MPVHHGPSDSRGLSAGAAAAAGRAQPTVTPSHHHNHNLSGLAPDGFSQGSMAPLQTPAGPSDLACGDRYGSRGFPMRSVLSEHIYFRRSLAEVRIGFAVARQLLFCTVALQKHVLHTY